MTDDLHGPNTKAVHGGYHRDAEFGAVAPPIYQSSTFAFDSVAQGAARFKGTDKGYIYTRMGNPTTAALEEAVALLEGGHAGLATGSGMAAIVNVLFTYLGAGMHMVGTEAVYGPSRVVVERDFSRFGVESDFVDTSDLDAVKAAIKPNTKLLFVETPANPTIKITDLAGCAEMAIEHPAVEWVRYPGLENHPQRDLVKKQMTGAGALLAFGVKGGLEAGRIVMEKVKVAVLAVSLGGVETLIQHPASMTHAAMKLEDREKAGITDGLIRLSVGIEDLDDLLGDLKAALDALI